MAGGIYTALSGMQARLDQLDRLASDIANVGTAGYKAERTSTIAAERPSFQNALESAIDVATGPGRLDFRSGAVVTTGRELDLALEGRGFFVVSTPQGERYTRNGQFSRQTDGTLTTADGMVVQGADGPITLAKGDVVVEADGTVRAGETVAGRLKVVDVGDYSTLVREDAGRFRLAATTAVTAAASTAVKAGALEQSNVSVADRMAQLIEVRRTFEALQRGLSMLANDIDQRAINEFGKR
jgi:flagellar basal-body rod protein FlgG